LSAACTQWAGSSFTPDGTHRYGGTLQPCGKPAVAIVVNVQPGPRCLQHLIETLDFWERHGLGHACVNGIPLRLDGTAMPPEELEALLGITA
jgi:hypothetical protein